MTPFDARSVFEKQIVRTVYAYGSFERGRFGYMVLKRDGSVGFYKHANEIAFRFQKGSLYFVDADGHVDPEALRYDELKNTFMSSDRYLIPVVSLNGGKKSPFGRSVIVNSIPKAGTYLVEALLSYLQFQPLGLHLSSNFFDDNRSVTPEQYHVAPHLRRIDCPAAAIASVMRPGELVVGHIGAPQLHMIGAGDSALIHLVRNIRSALVSLYRFKQEQVAPLDSADLLWRSLPEPHRFKAFLVNSQKTDVPYIVAVAEAILGCDTGLRLQFEDVVDSSKTHDVTASLSELLNLPVSLLANALQHVSNRSTSTKSKSPTRPDMVRDLWSDDVEAFFRSTGLFRCNKALGYE